MRYKELLQVVGEKTGDKMEYIKSLQFRVKNNDPDSENIKKKIEQLLNELYNTEIL